MKCWIIFQIVAFKDEIFSSFVDNDLAAMIVRNLRTFSIMIFHFVIADIKNIIASRTYFSFIKK